MANPIVTTSAQIIEAPSPATLQQSGAFISQGGTTLAPDTYEELVVESDLASILSAPITLVTLTQSAGVATAVVPNTTITTGSYTSGSGLVSLTLASSLGVTSGLPFTAASVTGSGSFGDIDGNWVAGAGSGGTTLNYTVPTGLTMTISGGNVSVMGIAAADTFLTTISGANQTGYNGNVEATVATYDSFTYTVSSDTVTPATGPVEYTPPGVADLVARNAEFWAQGDTTTVSVLELGPGEPAAGPPALYTWIEAQPRQLFYAYLPPRDWDGLSAYLTLLGEFETPTSQTYFFTTTTVDTYTDYMPTMKGAFLMVDTPGIDQGAEFDCATAFFRLISQLPSGTNQFPPFEYGFTYDTTAWPPAGNAATFAAFALGNVSYIGTGQQGGLSTNLIFGGNYADGNVVNLWYGTDWVSINGNVALANAVIEGSNSQPPLYYDQPGINTLQMVLAGLMNTGIADGLVLNPVLQTELDGPTFLANYRAGLYANFSVINAVPFAIYVQENPDNYGIGLYTGFTIAFTPLRGFDKIVNNLIANFL